MSFSKSFKKLFVVYGLCVLLACCSGETKTNNSSDAAISDSKTPLTGAATGLVSTSVKLDGQESYPRVKSQHYPQSGQGYVQQEAVYERDPYKSYDEIYKNSEAGKDYRRGTNGKYESQYPPKPSQSGYADSFEDYKQRYLSHQAPQPYQEKGPYSGDSSYDNSQGTSYGQADYGKVVAIPQDEHPDVDYGHHQDSNYESDEYSKDIPYGTKLSSKAYSQEEGQKYGSYDQAKYPVSKPKYVHQVSKDEASKGHDSKSYEDSDYGKDYSYGGEKSLSGYQDSGDYSGQKYPQIQQHALYDELDVKHVDEDSSYASPKSKEGPQKGFVTSYYYRGDKAYSSYAEKIPSKSYPTSVSDEGYLPKEAGYITTGAKESSYGKDSGHAEKTDVGYYGGQKKAPILSNSGVPGEGKVAIFIKQLGHSAAGNGYGSKSGERHGYLLLPVAPGKEGDALRIMKNAYGKKLDDSYQDVALSGYGQSPVLASKGKSSGYKDAELGYKPVYEGENYYNQKPIVIEGGKGSPYDLGYDVVLQDGGKSRHNAQINKGNDYTQDGYPYGISGGYKHSEKPMSSYNGKGTPFVPIIPKSNHGAGLNGYGLSQYNTAPAYKTDQYPPNYGKTNNYYSNPSSQYLSKGTTQGFRPSTHFPSKVTSAAQQIPSDYSSYGKNEDPKYRSQNVGYGNTFDSLSFLPGYQIPKSSVVSQRRIKSYAIILQKPQDLVQDAVYKASSYPAESVVKTSKLSSESKFKPIIGKRRASLYHGSQSFPEPLRSQKH